MAEANINVSLVEDRPDDAWLIQLMLGQVSKQQFQVEWHESQSETLERVSHGAIDIILLDMSLLDSKGISTLVKIHSKASNVLIIVLTGLDDEMVGNQEAMKALKATGSRVGLIATCWPEPYDTPLNGTTYRPSWWSARRKW